jgi:hypothetical protein
MRTLLGGVDVFSLALPVLVLLHPLLCREADASAAGVWRRTASAFNVPKHAPLTVDFEALFDQSYVEERVALAALQELRPPKPEIKALGEVLSTQKQPWDEAEEIPSHKWRTFDVSRKYRTLLRTLCPQRPADTVLLLRLLFDEDKIGKEDKGGRANPRGTRPLTVGEISENWEELVRDRCIGMWAAEEGVSRADAGAVEGMLAAMDSKLLDVTNTWLKDDFSDYAESIRLHPEVMSAITDLIRGRCEENAAAGQGVTILLRSSSPLAHPDLQDNTRRLLASALGTSTPNLTVVGGLSDIESAIRRSMEALDGTTARKISEEEGAATTAAYISAYWNPLVLLSGTMADEEPSLFLCEWAQRHSTFMERAKAKANDKINFLTAEELLSCYAPSTAAGSSTWSSTRLFGDEFILGSAEASAASSPIMRRRESES